MTRRQLRQRVERWRLVLVPEWRITLEDRGPHGDEDEDRYNASIQASEDYLHARLWVREGFYREQHDGEVDATIAHELMHLLIRELRRTLDLIEGQIHRDVMSVITDRFKSEEERVVERLARVVALLDHHDGLLYGTR